MQIKDIAIERTGVNDYFARVLHTYEDMPEVTFSKCFFADTRADVVARITEWDLKEKNRKSIWS